MAEPSLDTIADRVLAAVAPSAARVRTGAVLDQATVDRLGLEQKFPHLLGRVCAGEHRAPVGALTTAACYTLYPTLGGVEAGARLSVRQQCYRHEPSDDPYRLCSFEMVEVVAFDTPDRLAAWAADVRDRAVACLASMGLPVGVEAANDPFFGETGRLLADFQRDRELKHELTFTRPDGRTVALGSINRHGPSFVDLFGLGRGDGPLESACFGVGLDRVRVALREAGAA